MNNYLFILLIISIKLPLFAQSNLSIQEKANWVNPYLQSINSVEFEDTTYQDLQFLKQVLKDKRIVMLGENHTDGTTLKAKNRLIRFLHKEMGYRVLVEEHSFHIIHRKNDFVRSENDMFEFLVLLYSHLQSTIDAQRYRYMYKSWQSKTPLHWAGVDLMIYSIVGTKKYFQNYFSQIDPNLVLTKEWKKFNSYIDSLPQIKTPAQLDRFKKYVDFCIEATKGRNTEKDKYARQALKNMYGSQYFIVHRPNLDVFKATTESKEREKIESYFALRDKQMADNLLFFIEEIFLNEKIIVSASNYHIAKNIEEAKLQNPYLLDVKPMGQFIHEKYKEQSYHIGFIKAEGRNGIVYDSSVIFASSMASIHKPKKIIKLNSSNDRSEKVEEYKSESIESIFKTTGKKFAFIDFASISRKDSLNWLNKPNEMNSVFHKPFKIDWTKVYDGLFFIKTMEPDYQKDVGNIMGHKGIIDKYVDLSKLEKLYRSSL